MEMSLFFSGPMIQFETDRWIQNMEGHMKNNTIAGKDMKKPCTYKLCGEIGHNHKENKDEYPHKRRITKGVSQGSQGTSVGDCSQGFCCSNGSSVYIVGKDP